MTEDATMEGVDIDAWLDHKASGSENEGGRFLGGDWKKDGELTLWLHTRAGMPAVWLHDFVRVVTKNDGSGTFLWRDRWVCRESEDVLRRQHFRTDDDLREAPPQACPICLFVEAVRTLVREGKIAWTDPVLVFQTSKGKTIYHAAGLHNGYRLKAGEHHTVQQRKELSEAAIVVKDAFREAILPKCFYLFTVVQDLKPEEGIKITFETAQGLGAKMKNEIMKRIKAHGAKKDLGNPTKNPYPFTWTYDEEQAFEKKYDVAAGLAKPSPEIYELIVNTPPPDTTADRAPGNCIEAEMTLMEGAREAGVYDLLPWDEIFGPARKAGWLEPEKQAPKKGASPKSSETKAKPDPDPKDAAAPKQETPKPTTAKSKPAEDETSDPAAFECEICEGPMGAHDFECKKCGAIQDDDGNVISRRCGKCNAAVDITQATADASGKRKAICGKCGSIHDVETWEHTGGRLPKRSATKTQDEIPFK